MKKAVKMTAVLLCSIMIAGSFFFAPAKARAEDREAGVVIENGIAIPSVEFSNPRSSTYTNSGSEIIRFAVYVETDYDTDLDSKPDLIKAYVQVPRAAFYGEYDAPTIYEARPYIAGGGTSVSSNNNSINEDDMRIMHPKRVPVRYADNQELENNARVSDWYYTLGGETCLGNYNTYDYFLVRGFAVVQCAGPGTYGSEGFEVCGTDMEVEAFKDVVEWICGRRVAYTDLTSNVAVTADWSNGKVGMTGRSYAGTLCYTVATTGVEGLETIVPVAGISSWYSYSNSQGISHFNYYDYTTYLMGYCSSRFSGSVGSALKTLYGAYLGYCARAQNSLKGDFGDYWETREYTNCDTINATAMIVHGLNDTNVRTSQFDMMRDSFLISGRTVKTVLHLNGHVTPGSSDDNTEIYIGGRTYSELLNLWFCHYLLGVNNGAENLPEFSVQSNIDGKFYARTEWKTGNTFTLNPPDSSTKTVSTSGAETATETIVSRLKGNSNSWSDVWTVSVPGGLTINGPVRVNLRVKSDASNANNYPRKMSAILVDQCDTAFNAYNLNGKKLPYSNTGEVSVQVEGFLNYNIVNWTPTKVNRKVIAIGMMDLGNPEAGYDPRSAVTRSTPVQKGVWYDYSLYLQPNFYTVAPGHTLELYIVPFCEGAKVGTSASSATSYNFTVDHANSSAVIPVTNEFGIPLEQYEITPQDMTGDVNGDGVISVLDLKLLKSFIASSSEELDEASADVNGDGVVNIRDVIYMRKILASAV